MSSIRGEIRAALVGCGTVAIRGLIPGWLPETDRRRPQPAPFLDFGGASGLRITALCDPDPEALEQAQAILPRATISPTWRHLLKNHSDLDAVLLATPTHLHEPQAIEALRADLDLFVEKPCARTSAGLAEVCRLAQERRRVTMVHLPWRFTSQARALMSAATAGLVGRIAGLYGEFRHGGPRRWAPRADWYFGSENPGASLSDLGPHVLDLMSCLGGRAELLSCNHRYSGESHHATCGLHFECGAEGVLATGWDSLHPIFRITVVGTEGTLRAHLAGPDQYLEHTPERLHPDIFHGKLVERAKKRFPWTRFPNSPVQDAGPLISSPYAHFVSCVRSRQQPETSIDRVRNVEELLLHALGQLQDTPLSQRGSAVRSQIRDGRRGTPW